MRKLTLESVGHIIMNVGVLSSEGGHSTSALKCGLLLLKSGILADILRLITLQPTVTCQSAFSA
jgi:hypothetical protein